MATDVDSAIDIDLADVKHAGPDDPGTHDGPELDRQHLLRSVQDGRKALRRATLAIIFSAISATGAWTNFGVTIWRLVRHG